MISSLPGKGQGEAFDQPHLNARDYAEKRVRDFGVVLSSESREVYEVADVERKAYMSAKPFCRKSSFVIPETPEGRRCQRRC